MDPSRVAPVEAGEEGRGAWNEAELGPRERQHWFWGAVVRHWWSFAQVVIASSMINIFGLASSLFVMAVYDRVIPNDAVESLIALAVGMGIVLAFDFVLKTLRSYFIDFAGREADRRIAADIFGQLMNIDLAHRRGSSGAFANTLREFETLREFLASATLTTFVDLPFVLLFVFVIWMIGGPLAIVPALAVPIVLVGGLLVQPFLARAASQGFKSGQSKHAILVETIAGLETVKSAGAQSVMTDRWADAVERQSEIGRRTRVFSQLAINLAGFTQQAAQVAIVFYGVFLVRDGAISIGALIASVILLGRTLAPLSQIASLLTRFNHAIQSYRAIDRMMKLPVEAEPGRRYLSRPKVKGKIEFRRVTFRYPGASLPVLQEVSFTLQPGERVAVLGRVGSGKSTIVRLASGLYRPEDGAVMLDDTDVRQLRPEELRRHVGAVLQDAHLFSGSVRDNIVVGREDATDERVLAAASVAGVHDFIGAIPNGYDLQIAERGEGLSGGQRQAIAIARCLIMTPRVLVLDEPTSAMDVRSEQLFVKRMRPWLQGRTVLLITHRTSLLELVDRIIVLDQGKVVADGPKAEVTRALAGRSESPTGDQERRALRVAQD